MRPAVGYVAALANPPGAAVRCMGFNTRSDQRGRGRGRRPQHDRKGGALKKLARAGAIAM